MKPFHLSILAPMLLAACQTTGDPVAARVATGVAGGAVAGRVIGRSTEATLAGAFLGGLVAGKTAPAAPVAGGIPTGHPCTDIYARTDLHPEAKADRCAYRQDGVEHIMFPDHR